MSYLWPRENAICDLVRMQNIMQNLNEGYSDMKTLFLYAVLRKDEFNY